MISEADWISTPHIRPDHRGPVSRPYEPFVDPAHARPVIAMLREVAARHPDRVAIEDDAGAMTYAALMRAVARVAGKLAPAAGPVGILLPSSAAYAVAVFAALAAGRVSVLLDAGYPGARTAAIVHATGVDTLLGEADVAAALHDAAPAPALPETYLDLDAPAFVLCTSGSAGAPKAIAHSQRAMLHWARTTHDALHVRPDDCVVSLSSPATLGGFTALLSYPLAGASIRMLDLITSGLGGLTETLRDGKITILRSTPSLLRSLAELAEARGALQGIRVAQTYGEPLMKTDLAVLRGVLPGFCLVRSTYGSTEASGLSWFAEGADEYDPHRVASGVLMPDTSAVIVDEDGRAVPPGMAGELWIRSRYNALGAWSRDGLAAAGRMFRTGDIARYHCDGVFVILGRRDRMAKINGQRLEPAEVEAALRRLPEVAGAAVLIRPGEAGAALTAFVVARAGASPAPPALRRALRSALPAFMVPARIAVVDAIPLLPGGKTDEAALLGMLA